MNGRKNIVKKCFLNYLNQRDKPRIYLSILKSKNLKCAKETLQEYGYDYTENSIYNLDKKETYSNYKNKCKIIAYDPDNIKNIPERVNYVNQNYWKKQFKYRYIGSAVLWFYIALLTVSNICRVKANRRMD